MIGAAVELLLMNIIIGFICSQQRAQTTAFPDAAAALVSPLVVLAVLAAVIVVRWHLCAAVRRGAAPVPHLR